ncbi:hypothetical protein [uncultured Phocaeicola sp.]|nr:hypothetical protein [uncultured Phocaeicola sp.]
MVLSSLQLYGNLMKQAIKEQPTRRIIRLIRFSKRLRHDNPPCL